MKNRIQLIFGKTGTGKTTLAKKIIESETEVNNIIIVDTLHEYDYLIIENYDNFVDYILTHDNYKISCRFDNDIDIEFLFETVFYIKNVLLVLEEAEIYINAYAKSSNFLRLVRYGRHSNIKLLGIARRTSELSKDFRSQVNTIYSFKQTDIQDLKNMSDLGLYDLDKLNEHDYKQITY